MIELITHYASELHNPATIFLKKDETKAARLRQAVLDHALFDTRPWRSITDITFTLKQVYHSEIGHWAQPEIRGRTKIDEVQCSKAFDLFMRLLNRAVYKNAYNRRDKRLRVIAVIEKHRDGRWHYHAAIEPPKHLAAEAFETLINKCWHKTHWGYYETYIRPNADSGWINYMLKDRQKSGLDAWSDTIDWNNINNPIADD